MADVEKVVKEMAKADNMQERARLAGQVSSACRMGLNITAQLHAAKAGVFPLLADVCSEGNSEDTRRQGFKTLSSLCLNNVSTANQALGNDKLREAIVVTLSDGEFAGSRLWNDCAAAAATLASAASRIPNGADHVVQAMHCALVHPKSSTRTVSSVLSFLDFAASNPSTHQAFLTTPKPTNAAPHPRPILHVLFDVVREGKDEITVADAAMAVAKVAGLDPCALGARECPLRRVVELVVGVLECAVEGTKHALSSTHASISSAAGAACALVLNQASHPALFDLNAVETIAKATLSSKVRADISKSRGDGGNTSRRSSLRVREGEEGDEEANLVASLERSAEARALLLQALWHLAFTRAFAVHIANHPKLPRQLAQWAQCSLANTGKDRGAAQLRSARQDDADARTKEGAAGVLWQLGLSEDAAQAQGQGNNGRIAVCAAPEDASLVERLVAALDGGGLQSVSLANKFSPALGVRVASHPDTALVKTASSVVGNCALVLVVLSDAMFANPACRLELCTAVRLNKPLAFVATSPDARVHGWVRDAVGQVLAVTVGADDGDTHKVQQLVRHVGLVLDDHKERPGGAGGRLDVA